MKNKKKLVSLVIVLALAVTSLVGGTLAYFTDTDDAKNVMTLGGVDIMQNEQQHTIDEEVDNCDNPLVDVADDGFETFVQDKPLMPMVDKRAEGDEAVVEGYFNPLMRNVVDKIVTVSNVADAESINKEAYVRTIFAFEGRSDVHDAYIGILKTDADVVDESTTWTFEYVNETYTEAGELVARMVEIDGVTYTIAEAVYHPVLNPAETTVPSLRQIFLAPTADNEVQDWFGETYDIICVSQAVQVAGFDDAVDALNTAWGDLSDTADVTDAELIAWLEAAMA